MKLALVHNNLGGNPEAAIQQLDSAIAETPCTPPFTAHLVPLLFELGVTQDLGHQQSTVQGRVGVHWPCNCLQVQKQVTSCETDAWQLSYLHNRPQGVEAAAHCILTAMATTSSTIYRTARQTDRLARSGQEHKCRIKALAHAKDGDCFGLFHHPTQYDSQFMQIQDVAIIVMSKQHSVMYTQPLNNCDGYCNSWQIM